MDGQTNDKTKVLRTAAIISLTGNAVLAVLKISAGLLSRSGALTADGIDSSADVFISLITLAIVLIMARPADKKHPWGQSRVETIATAFFAFVLFFIGAQFTFTSFSNFMRSGRQTVPSIYAIILSIVSIVGKFALAYIQHKLGKRADSVMLKANAKNIANDVLVSFGVLLGLILTNVTGSGLADRLIALLIGIWIMKTAVDIFLEVNLELVDSGSETTLYKIVLEAVDSTEGASNPHRSRMRRIAGFWDVSLDIDVDPGCTVTEARGIAASVEEKIKEKLENVYDIMIRVEPREENP